MKFLIVAMGFLSFFFGACSKPKVPTKPLPEITVNSENDGFIDLDFVIRSHETLSDGSQALHAYGVHQGREVGVNIVLGTQWKKGKMGSMTTYQGTLSYRSLGASSDALLQVFDQLYGTNLQPKTIRSTTTFAGISLSGDPSDLTRGPTKIKLFFESDAEDQYAELYTNIDLAGAVLQIHEKDPEYRSAVIRALRLQ